MQTIPLQSVYRLPPPWRDLSSPGYSECHSPWYFVFAFLLLSPSLLPTSLSASASLTSWMPDHSGSSVCVFRGALSHFLSTPPHALHLLTFQCRSPSLAPARARYSHFSRQVWAGLVFMVVICVRVIGISGDLRVAVATEYSCMILSEGTNQISPNKKF